jgi:uncharacterized protein YndB with AHSA1/START domain
LRGFKRLILGLFLLLAVMVAVAFALPRNVAVERSAVINAPEMDVFPYLVDLRKFNEWSPWAKRDPETHYVFEGAREGKGARMEWNSDQIGTGEMEIVEIEANKSVVLALDFGAKGTATASYLLSPAGAGTKVTWGINTDVGNNPMARWTGLMLDRWIGADYEEGLANLKKLVEAKTSGR